jgi:hypothetical protein
MGIDNDAVADFGVAVVVSILFNLILNIMNNAALLARLPFLNS